MPVSCDPQALLAAAAPYQKIKGGGLENEVIIYLLNQILGTGMTPQQLIDGAKCYACIPSGEQEQVIAYLLCQIINA